MMTSKTGAAETVGVAGVMGRLKAETAAHHARAEGTRLQKAMARGQATREQYAEWLGQMLLVHRALEQAIERARPAAPLFRHVTEQQKHSPRLEQDLEFLGVDAGGVRASDATARLMKRIGEIGRTNPVAVLGLHYVLEGSMNGNSFIAVAVRRSLGLERGQGDKYIDPYGKGQRVVWTTFREAINSETFSAADADAVVEAAQAMFDGVTEIGRELMPD